MTQNSGGDSQRTDKREDIIAEAVRLFNENGYADTRLEDIGARLGTVKTSVSYHFKSKEGLLAEVYDRALGFSETAVQQAAEQPTGLEGVQFWLRAHASAHARALSGLAQPLALIADMPFEPNGDGGAIRSRYSALVSDCQRLIERGLADGSVQVSSVPAALFFLLNMTHWLPRWLAEVRTADIELAIEGMIDILSSGVVADPDRRPARSINRNTEDSSESVFDRAARNRAKREAFLRAGTRALNECGYRSLSLNDVAAELGVTRGAFYYHIADKDALLTGCFERTLDLIETAQRLSESPEIDGIGMLERSTRWLFERQISNLDPLIRPGLISALPDKERQLVTVRLGRLRTGFGSMIARGIRDGSARAVDTSAAEHLVLGAIFAGSHRRQALLRASGGETMVTGEQVSPSAYFEMFFMGMRARDQ